MNMDKSYPYNAVNGDRTHDATDIARMLAAVVTTGIMMAPSNSLQVLAGGDFNVTVKAGVCVIDGHIGINDNDKTFTVAVPSSGANPIDRIIARADYANRINTIFYVQGTPASSPQPPGLANNTTARDISLAQIYVGQTVSSITQSAITDERTACGLAAPSPVDALMSQFRADFNTWMTSQETTFQGWANRIQAALESSEAGQVLSLITQLQTGKQDALSASNLLPLTLGGTGAKSAAAARSNLGLGALATKTLLSGTASITIAAGDVKASLVITFSPAFAAVPVPMGLVFYGTSNPQGYGGKQCSLSGLPTATGMTIAVGIGVAQTVAVSIPVCWSVLG
jgi:hypothetical protein